MDSSGAAVEDVADKTTCEATANNKWTMKPVRVIERAETKRVE